MAYAKNKNQNKASSSSRMHISRATIQTSQRARSKSFDRKVFSSIKKTVLSIIILASLAVILATIFASISTPENTIKSKIQSLATNYYENTYYENLTSFATTERSLSQIMEPYTKHGFPKITLEQLLLQDPSSANTINSYCNSSATYVTIYPDPPYGHTDYHIDYTYSCNF